MQEADGHLGLYQGSHSDDESCPDNTIQLQSQLFEKEVVDVEDVEMDEVSEELIKELEATILLVEESK